MKALTLFIVIPFIAIGCAATQPADTSDRLPHLIEQDPFPPLPDAFAQNNLVVNLRLLIAENGTVSKGEIMNPSGSPGWDSLALLKIKKWVFTPAVHDGKPLTMWINLSARVKFEEPVYMRLAEVVCPTAAIADSVHGLLLGGENFALVASAFSISQTKDQGGVLGQVDICRYRDDVRKMIADLRENEVTEPLVVGEKYVIYKRLPEEVKYQ